MLKYILILNAFSIIFVSLMHVVEPGPTYPPTKGKVWPKPKQLIKHYTYYKFLPSSFKFTVKQETCTTLKTAIDRYTKVLYDIHRITLRASYGSTNSIDHDNNTTDFYFRGTIEELQINLNHPCQDYPQLYMDERYTLNVLSIPHLTSDSIWGVLRGMETFVQLFYISNDYKNVYVNATEITDYPSYYHRGLLIDTSRHYLSVSNILKTLDAMEMNKMNVLHWHIVDDQSFPYVSERFPQLSGKGAYDSSMVYTSNDISKILDYARDRAVRVLPEFDVPGHTRSWGGGYPDILTKCYRGGKLIGLGPMDPTNNKTYQMIGKLFKEVQDRFPDKYIHVGGDEVELTCWASNPKLQAFMKQHHMSDASKLHAYFMKHVIPLLGKKSIPIVWQDVFDDNVPLSRETIIHV